MENDDTSFAIAPRPPPRPRLPRQGQVGDRQRPAGKRVPALDPVAVAKRVKLFDIAQLLTGLPLNPGAQAHLEGAVFDLERA